MRLMLLLPSTMAFGCTVGTSLPFGGGSSTYYGPRPPQGSAPVASDDEGTPAAADEVESRGELTCVQDGAGNTFSSAAKLAAKGVKRGCLDNTGTDVYALTAGANPGGTIFGVKLMSKESTCVELFDQDKKSVTASECAWGTHSEFLWAAVAPNTTVYLRVERSNQKISPYLLDLSEKLIADDEEPNNSWKTAIPLALNTPHEALLGDVVNDKGETRDFYKIVLAKPTKVSIVIDPTADDVRPKFTIYDADRRKLKSEDADNRGAILREDVELAAGTFYVEIEEYGWGIGYGNGPAGSGSNGADAPSGHYTRPYKIEITGSESTKRKKTRVSKR